MNALFISHASEDADSAKSLRAWLKAHRWPEVFLSSHPSRGIDAGEDWRRSIESAVKRSRAVVLLVSSQWIDSENCRQEYRVAALLDKPVIPVVIDQACLGNVPDELQMLEYCDISNQVVEDEGYERLRSTLALLWSDDRSHRRLLQWTTMLGAIPICVLAIACWPLVKGLWIPEAIPASTEVPSAKPSSVAGKEVPKHVAQPGATSVAQVARLNAHECRNDHFARAVASVNGSLDPVTRSTRARELAACAYSYICNCPTDAAYQRDAAEIYCFLEAGGTPSESSWTSDKTGMVIAGTAGCLDLQLWRQEGSCKRPANY